MILINVQKIKQSEIKLIKLSARNPKLSES